MKLSIDPIACQSHGLCAELLPELIILDDWGHPILPDRDIPPGLERLARRAVRACPTLALRMEASVAARVDVAGRAVRGSRSGPAGRAPARAREPGR